MSNINALAIRDTAQHPILPSPDEVAIITEGLADLDYVPYGTVKMPSGGMKAFNVTEAGNDEADPQKPPFEAIIIHSHKQNSHFVGDMGDGQPPVCNSNDGVTGIETATGMRIACATCPHNQFGSGANGSKACKNSRRLYLLRPGDIFPMVMNLPATGMRAYDQYAAKLILNRKPVHGVLTSIGLKEAVNKGGIKYYAPTFDAKEALSPEAAAEIKAYAEKFVSAISRQPDPEPEPAQPQNYGYGEVPNSYKPVSNDEGLPF